MPKIKRPMTSRQCEIAAESYAACLLAQSGYDVFVQYGARQQDYDLVATKEKKSIRISVKGSQDGGWMLAVRYLKKGMLNKGANYIAAINEWESRQHDNIIYMFVGFRGISLHAAPNVYIADPSEVAEQMRSQSAGQGKAVLREDTPTHHPHAKHQDKIPDSWHYSTERIDSYLS
jgi:Holliday junction resolvase-like predicted endonuclease